jgi:hypothetical protein
MYRWWPRPHVHAGMPVGIVLVKVGIPVIGAVVPVQVDRKNLEDRSPLRSEVRKQIRARQDVVEVVVQHVEVVENRSSFGELLGEIGSRLRHHRHEPPLDRRPAEIAVVEGDHFRHQLLLPFDVAQELNVVDRRLQPVIRPDLSVELAEAVPERF